MNETNRSERSGALNEFTEADAKAYFDLPFLICSNSEVVGELYHKPIPTKYLNSSIKFKTTIIWK